MTTVFRTDRGTREGYAQLVRFNSDLFTDAWGDIAPSEFAAVAWRIATPPFARSAAYVRWHRRVLSAEAVRNSWDGTLVARVQLVAPSPVNLGALPPVPSGTPPTSPFGDDQVREPADGAWRGWANTFGQFVAPTDHDLARGPFLRASVLVEAPLPLAGLPDAPEGPVEGFEEDADRAVGVLVRAMDRLLAPVVAGLESSELPQ
ncbi:hypothetical protein [Cryptosporangium aurantiacum]|uniref:Uncharacterized protein n=1 Tax=Cryptosporangium aurantiacum TaxID=134849 RepID=A0A1M7RB62_9ACTN|nr:hypothetical protein [Cryptosporangium aurantiacum]SHN43456.1 hypothetical protein SAMN05443668_109178 [Cryptosporangium aurantiacum]